MSSLVRWEPLMRWDPLRDLASLQHDVDRLFSDAGVSRVGRAAVAGLAVPSMDVFARDGDLVLRAELPGVKPEEIDISATDDVLTIKAEHEDTHEVKEEDFLLRETTHGRFERSLRLPAGSELESISADYKDGVLEITIPKGAPRTSTTRRIEVTARASESPPEHH